jgi:hypothetical protein
MLPAEGKFNIIDIAGIRPDANVDSRFQPAKVFDPGCYFGVGCDYH